jgi:hypothetical protein
MNLYHLHATHLTHLWIGPLMGAVFLGSCASPPAPDSYPEPSKQEIRRDADRFFEKMRQGEEGGTGQQ